MIAVGLMVGRDSGGTFDIGVGDLVAAWGFNAEDARPDAELVERLRATPRRAAHGALPWKNPIGPSAM